MTDTDGDRGERRRSAQIRALRFEQLVYSLLVRRETGEIVTEFRLSSGRTVDIVVQSRDRPHQLIEVKYVSPQTGRRVREARQQLIEFGKTYSEQHDGQTVSLVLAFAGVLGPEYVGLLSAAGITLWDAKVLLEWADPFPDMRAEFADLLGMLTSGTPLEERSAALPEISRIPCGRDDWSRYQRTVRDILEYLFCPPLRTPYLENANLAGVNRRDIVVPNYAESGFWAYMTSRYHADYVIVDAKNYCANIGKDQVLQVANYLSLGGPGLFGMIITRKGADASAEYICREQWVLHGKMIITLVDADVSQMLSTKNSGGDPAELVRQKIEDFRLSI